MTTKAGIGAGPEHVLTVDRVLDAPVEKPWRCWTEPALLEQWFCPRPWYVTDVRMDLRPGGEFYSVFNGPDGESFENAGVFLEVEALRRLISTDAFRPGWTPSGRAFMVAETLFEDAGDGRTRYIARAMHWDRETLEEHERMGFHEGWGREPVRVAHGSLWTVLADRAEAGGRAAERTEGGEGLAGSHADAEDRRRRARSRRRGRRGMRRRPDPKNSQNFSGMRRTPAEAGRRLGVILLFGTLGMALGGWFAGYLFDSTGRYRPAFVVGAAANVANLVIVLALIGRTRTGGGGAPLRRPAPA